MKIILLCLLFFSFSPSTVTHAFDAITGQGGSVPSSRRPRRRPTDGPCRISNSECRSSGSQVQIDLAAQCMCVGRNCFQIAIGRYGPNQTRNGTGRIGRAPGSRYRTRSQTTTTWDNDAVSMGIPQNDAGRALNGRNLPVTAGGKWIHKVGMDRNGRCVSPPTSYRTAGCVGVPCDQWPLVKGAMGQSLTVCGGASRDSDIISRNGCRGTRNCHPESRRPPYGGCRRARAMYAAMGYSSVQCDERSGEVRITPFRARPGGTQERRGGVVL